MSEPTSYIVGIDEMGNPSIKYADGTPYSVNISDYSAEVLKQLVPRKLNYTVVNQIDGLYIAATKGSEKFQLPYSPDAVYGDGNKKIKNIITEFCNPHRVTAEATFEEGDVYINCGVTVKIGELEFGPFLFLHEKIQGGGSGAAQDENVDLPETD